jgi:hypothetical protein
MFAKQIGPFIVQMKVYYTQWLAQVLRESLGQLSIVVLGTTKKHDESTIKLSQTPFCKVLYALMGCRLLRNYFKAYDVSSTIRLWMDC